MRSFQAIEKLTPQLDFVLKMAFSVLPVTQNIFICLLVLGGISCLAATFLIFFFFNISVEQSNLNFESIKYTAVFPYIKREIAKFEEREREMIQKVESV